MRVRTDSSDSSTRCAAGELLEVLRERPEAHGRAAPHLAPRRLELAGEQAQQRRLARAVDPDDTDAVAGSEAPGEPCGRTARSPSVTLTSSTSSTDLPEAGGREPQELGAVARDGLVGDQRVRGVDAEARLGRARRRPAPEPRELLAQQVLAPPLA